MPVGAKDGAYSNINCVDGQREGSLRAPAEPGLYEVRLQLDGSGRVLAMMPVEVLDAEVKRDTVSSDGAKAG